MIMYYHTSDIRKADVIAVEKYSFRSLDLMENAGRNAASLILSSYPNVQNITILAGAGNNGGDGFVAARYFTDYGKNVSVITSAAFDKYKNDALPNLELLISSYCGKCTVIPSTALSDEEITDIISKSDLIVDALLGTGSSGAPRGEISRLISFCSDFAPTVSFDIPSGIDAESGAVYANSVKADMTVTFLAPKIGMAFYPAKARCGMILTASIGAEQELVLDGAEYLELFSDRDVKCKVPKLPRTIHKGDRGGVLIYGGSNNYRGAPILSALGALRSGAGLVVLAIPDFMIDMASVAVPEAIFVPLPTSRGSVLHENSLNEITPWLSRCDSIVFGPGIGREAPLQNVLAYLLSDVRLPMLIDADGLFHLSKIKSISQKNNIVITPHAGEAAALLDISPQEVNKDRFSAVRKLTEHSGTALLKGMGTLVSDGVHFRQISEGSPVLAVPGSGDVLSGAIAAFLASGLSPFDAASVGASIHASAGCNLEKIYGTGGTLAREIADELRSVLREQL